MRITNLLSLYFIVHTCTSTWACVHARQTTYELIVFGSSSELYCDYTHTEVTSQGGDGHIQCAAKCLEHEGCKAFLRDNFRCVLIGHSNLPGNDIDSNELSWPREYYWKEIGNCLNGVCYQYVDDELTWATAETFCVDSYGGHLAKVADCDVHGFLMTYLTGKFLSHEMIKAL